MEVVPTTAGGGGGIGYADSVESSPRSRGGESWDEPFPSSAAAASRLRLMCSYGGRIVPRPTDRSLCYLGGETRIVVVDRQSSLADLSAKLSRSLLGGRSFSLKYQLPNEDLDSLISVTTDEDLDNMIEEYDRILQSSPAGAAAPGGGGGNTVSTRSNRLRLFLFPSNPDSASASSSIGSLLDDSKSETWFVDALNSAMGGGIDGLSADSASVNCLLGLEDDSSTHSRGVGVGSGGPAGGAASEPERLILPRPDSAGKLARHSHDVHSVPDSPMLDTTSSFGSTSSAPSLSHLPPIRVRPEDRPPDQRIGGLDDHFAHMNLSSAAAVSGQRPDEGYKDSNFPPHYPSPPPIPLPTGSSSTPTISPTENSGRVYSDDDKSDHGGVRKPLPPPQPKPTPIDAPISDSTTRAMYYPDRASSAASAVNPVSEPRRELPGSADPSYRVPMPVPDSGYVLPPVHREQLQQPQQQHQQQQQQQQQQQHQQQFIPANPHYIHHPATGNVVPVSSYYPIAHPIQQSQQAPHPYDSQIPMYFLPVRQNPPPYNIAAMPPNLADPAAAKPAGSLPRTTVRPELPANLYRTAAASAPPPAALQPAQPPPPLIRMAADQVPHQYAGMGYHVMHHHHPSQAPAAMANYGYEYADPAHAQMYYSQAAPPPQYHTVTSAAVIPDAAPGDVKQARAS